MSTEATTKTRTTPMRWIKLGEGKDPDFRIPVFLCDQLIGDPLATFEMGWLKNISHEEEGKSYGFVIGYDEERGDIIEHRFTHYAIPTKPAE